MAIGPSLAAEWITAARSRFGKMVRTLPALGLVSLLVAEVVFAIVSPNGGLVVTRRGAPEALRPRLFAIERLMASHPLVAISPDVSCYNHYFDMGDDNDSPAGAAANNTARFVSRAILAAADGGGSLTTSLSSRRPVCPYRQYEQALPPDTLAILFRSALVDTYPDDPGIFARTLPATYLCAEGDGESLLSPIGGVEGESQSLTIRVCSERHEEIIALAKEIDAQLTRGDDPWGVASEFR